MMTRTLTYDNDISELRVPGCDVLLVILSVIIVEPVVVIATALQILHRTGFLLNTHSCCYRFNVRVRTWELESRFPNNSPNRSSDSVPLVVGDYFLSESTNKYIETSLIRSLIWWGTPATMYYAFVYWLGTYLKVVNMHILIFLLINYSCLVHYRKRFIWIQKYQMNHTVCLSVCPSSRSI